MGTTRAGGATSAAGSAAGGAMLVADANTRFRSRDIRGRLLQGDGAGAPVPPGLSRLPRAGEVFVSPALADVLATPDGRRLLAPRIPGRVVGEIAPAGLIGPTDLAYYAGASDLVVGGTVRRLEHFGWPGPGEGLGRRHGSCRGHNAPLPARPLPPA